VNLGAELDALPYITGGYYFSGWAAKNNFKLRAIVASVNVPSFAVKSGFKDHQIKAYAVVVDYFQNPGLTGFWYGGGLERWKNKIKSSDENVSTEFTNTVITAGAGYVWPFYRHLYLNPWVAIHGIVDGDEHIQVGSNSYKPDAITGEVSLKIGVKY